MHASAYVMSRQLNNTISSTAKFPSTSLVLWVGGTCYILVTIMFFFMLVCLLPVRDLVWLWEMERLLALLCMWEFSWVLKCFPLYKLCFGLKCISKIVLFSMISTCTTKWVDTTRVYMNWKFFWAQICIVMASVTIIYVG